MPAIPIAALAISAVGVGVSLYEGQQANKAQNAALQVEQQQQQLDASRQQRDAVRQSRMAYAKSQQNAENQGAANSSASQGGLGSIKTQMDSNLSFLDSYNKMSQQAGKDLGQANTYKSLSETFGTIADIGMKVYGMSPSLQTMFGGMGGGGGGGGSSGSYQDAGTTTGGDIGFG